MVKGDGGHLPLNAADGPVNNWMHSLFSQVDVSLNGTLVTPSTNTYAYRAYIETLLSHGAEAKIVSRRARYGTKTRLDTWMRPTTKTKVS